MSGLLTLIRVLFRKPSFLFPFAAFCSMWIFHFMLSAIVTPRYFVFVSSARIWPCRVWISMDCHLPGYSDDRAFVRMELHLPVCLPPLQSLKVLLKFFAVIFCSEGEVYDGVICKQSN